MEMGREETRVPTLNGRLAPLRSCLSASLGYDREMGVTKMGSVPGIVRIGLAGLLFGQLVTGAWAAGSAPASVAIVKNPADTSGFDVGRVQVTFADGHQEFLDPSDKCRLPKISGKGDVGWSEWTDVTSDRYGHSSEVLRVKTHTGVLKKFKPNALFIENWAFADDDKAVVIESMQHHGPMYYIKYSLSGKKLGQVDGYVPYAQLPAWAQPISDDKP